MQTSVMIALKSIVVDKSRNVRKSYKGIEELASSIEQDTQLTPILVVPHEDQAGMYTLVAGFRRVMALKKLKHSEVKAEILALDPARVAWVNILENLQRSNLTSYETALGFAGMKDDHGWSGAEISRRYGSTEGSKAGFSSSHINNLIRAVKSLSEKAVKAWASGRLTIDAAVELSAYSHEDQDGMVSKLQGYSGNALRQILAEITGSGGGEGNSGSGSGGGGGNLSPSKRPSKKELELALAWATSGGHVECSQAIKWILGENSTLRALKATFDAEKFAKSQKA